MIHTDIMDYSLIKNIETFCHNKVNVRAGKLFAVDFNSQGLGISFCGFIH